MERRTPTQSVAQAVAHEMSNAGVTTITLSEATDISVPALRELLDGKSEFAYEQVAVVGGFFGLPTAHFFEKVIA